MRQSLAIWPWLVWYRRLGWSWIFVNSPALTFCNQLHILFALPNDIMTGALFCWCKNSNRKGKHESSIPFLVNNCRTRIQTKHQIRTHSSTFSAGSGDLEQSDLSQKPYYVAKGWRMGHSAQGMEHSWGLSTFQCAKGLWKEDKTVLTILCSGLDLRSPRRSSIEGLISSAVVLRGGPFGRWPNPEDLDLVTHPSVSNLLPTGHMQPRITIEMTQNKILNLLSTLWSFWITQLIRWFLSVTFVDDGVMLQYQKVDHTCCDGLTV